MSRFFWKAALLLALAAGAAIAALRALAVRPAAIGWVVSGEADGDSEKSILCAGQSVRVAEGVSGRVLLGPIDLRLAPGAEVRFPSASFAEVRAGMIEVTSSGGAFELRFAFDCPPVRLPPGVARASLTVGDAVEIFVADGVFEWGPLRVGPGERASAREGHAPAKK
jgi:hypothetical protein